MIKSMTGFGRCEISEGDRKFTVEMKGVNQRYLDMSIRMPISSRRQSGQRSRKESREEK